MNSYILFIKHVCWFLVMFIHYKEFGTFHVLLFGAFLCGYDNIYLPYPCIEEEIYKKIFY